MIEIHSHVLFGLDDGATDADQCRQLLLDYVRQGVTEIIGTPHLDLNQFSTYEKVDTYLDRARENYQEVCHMIESEQIPVRLHWGLELMLCSDLVAFLKRQRDQSKVSLGLAGSSYLLVELPRWQDGGMRSLEPILFQIQLLDFQTILAHPERAMRHAEVLPFLEEWVNQERVTLQVNTRSIVPPAPENQDEQQERYSRRNHYVRQLLDLHLVHFVASDAHDPDRRQPQNQAAFDWICGKYGHELAQLLTADNPGKILSNQPVQRSSVC